jgi:hypothetical protein
MSLKDLEQAVARLPAADFAEFTQWFEQYRTGARNGSKDASPESARERFERHFGSLDLGRSTGADNESIDADLAREYGGAR